MSLQRHRWPLTAVVLAALLMDGSAAAAPPATSDVGRPGATELRAVTLITGDQVVVASGPTGRRIVEVRPAPGREQVHFFTEQSGDRLRVVPADAVEQLGRGTLDRRLFEVDRLAQLEHADRGTLPLILQYQPAVLQRSTVPALPAGARRSARLGAIGADAITVDEHAAGALWAQLSADGFRAIREVWLDGERKLSLDVSVPMVHAPEAWGAGYTGQGTTVAVLDSGIDAAHPDLTDAVVEARNFTDEPDTDDTAGHGTHVASIITGSGSASGGRYQGVAPDARLLIGKVCGSFGTCADSAILAGMQWAAESGADVINLSLGGQDTPELDPLEQAVEQLSADYGVLVVAAAGNSGYEGAETVASPASADAALAVGAVSKSGEMYLGSSQGPRRGDRALKPDIVAPGVDIIAARAAHGWMGSPVDDHYTSMTGTSMAAPHVAGAAAIVAQQHPEWTASEIKAVLMGAADPLPAVGAFRQGGGLLDVADATLLQVTANPAGVSFGSQRWPHQDDMPITKTATYRNASDQQLTLDLSLQAVGPDGQPAPAGMFKLDRSSVNVPAGGQAEVSITADTRVSSADGQYTGWIVAAGAATELTIPFGVDKSIEAYDVTFDLRGRDGAPTATYDLVIGQYDDQNSFRQPYEADGELTVRLPAGQYFAIARIAGSDGTAATATLLTMPNLRADADQEVVFDASAAMPVSVTVPERSAELVSGVVGAELVVDSEFGPARPAWSVTTQRSWSGVYIGQIGKPAAPERFQAAVSGVWARPKGDGTFDDSPYVYNFGSFRYGSMPNGFVKRLRGEDFAEVRAEYEAQGGGDGTFAVVGSLGRSRNGLAFVVSSPNLMLQLPGARTEYFSTDDIMWTTVMQQATPVEGGGYRVDAEQFSSYQQYRIGKPDSVRWNGPVLGPSFAASPFSDRPWVVRQGNELEASIPLFSDANPDHVGYSAWDTGRTALYQNGEPIFETDEPGFAFAELPPEEAGYRLETSATRSLSGFSTRVDAAWTFRSGHAESVAALPVAAIRLLPHLDDQGAAPAGRSFTIPVAIQHQPGAPNLPVRQLAAEVSYDGGATWSAAIVKRHHDAWSITVNHPRRPGSVSMRANATDSKGNSVELTIIDAYRIR